MLEGVSGDSGSRRWTGSVKPRDDSGAEGKAKGAGAVRIEKNALGAPVVLGGALVLGALIFGPIIYRAATRGWRRLPADGDLPQEHRLPPGAVVDRAGITNNGTSITIPYITREGKRENFTIGAPYGHSLSDVTLGANDVLTARDQDGKLHTWHLRPE